MNSKRLSRQDEGIANRDMPPGKIDLDLEYRLNENSLATDYWVTIEPETYHIVRDLLLVRYSNLFCYETAKAKKGT